MTELSFLLELLLNHKLPKSTREAVAARIKEVEGGLVGKAPALFIPPYATAAPSRPPRSEQSPSTQAILAEKFSPQEIEKMNGDHSGAQAGQPAAQTVQPTPPVTPLAAQALQQRQAAIMKAVNSGPFGQKPEEGRTSPRKW